MLEEDYPDSIPGGDERAIGVIAADRRFMAETTACRLSPAMPQ
ncbi:hypothetical protein ACWF82_28875 [Nocardia sp. NPDC055053]